jgi:hypothetical protein
MAKDYYKYNILDDFEIRVIRANKDYYPTGITGYEAYYIDIQGFWRQLYNPEIGDKLDAATEELNIIIKKLEEEYQDEDGTLKDGLLSQLKDAKAKALAAENAVKAMDAAKEEDTKSEEVEPPLEEESKDPYMEAYKAMKDAQIRRDNLAHEVARLEENRVTLEKKIEDYTNTKENFNAEYWNKDIEQAPQTLNFWFDFLDTEGELQ